MTNRAEVDEFERNYRRLGNVVAYGRALMEAGLLSESEQSELDSLGIDWWTWSVTQSPADAEETRLAVWLRQQQVDLHAGRLSRHLTSALDKSAPGWRTHDLHIRDLF